MAWPYLSNTKKMVILTNSWSGDGSLGQPEALRAQSFHPIFDPPGAEEPGGGRGK